MLLDKQIQILVFKIDDKGTFDNIGEIDEFDSLIWPSKFDGFSEFELWAPINDENAELLKKGNVIWCRGQKASIVEIVKSSMDNRGTKTLHVKGRTLESLFDRRIVWDTYVGKGNVSTIMYDLVNKNCVNPTNPDRKIPFLTLSEDEKIGDKINFQRTGGTVYEALQDLASSEDIGFEVIFEPRLRKLVFKVLSGVDRTIEQKDEDPIEFSTDLEDIIKSAYYSNEQNFKNVALVAGEDSGTQRKKQIVGDKNSKGFFRRELYVDARDLQTTVTDDKGETVIIPDDEYSQMLDQRGRLKLSDFKKIETFESRIRVFGGVQYELGVDFFEGEKVTVRDRELGVIVSARITEVEEGFGKDYSLILTFGYSMPTLIDRIKQM